MNELKERAIEPDLLEHKDHSDKEIDIWRQDIEEREVVKLKGIEIYGVPPKMHLYIIHITDKT